MTSEYLGLRLNYKKHREIIKWLEKFDDRSEEARRLLALGIKVSSGEYTTPATPAKEEKAAPIVWTMPEETVKPITPKAPPEIKVEKPDFKKNIIGSFNV